MHDSLSHALAPILRDIAATGAALPDIRDEDWIDDPKHPAAMIYALDGSGTGISIHRDDQPAQQVIDIAAQVQEWVIENSAHRAATNWPACPDHPETHPREPGWNSGRPSWLCPTGGGSVTTIGSLHAG